MRPKGIVLFSLRENRDSPPLLRAVINAGGQPFFGIHE
jgi:hypothetical protein